MRFLLLDWSSVGYVVILQKKDYSLDRDLNLISCSAHFFTLYYQKKRSMPIWTLLPVSCSQCCRRRIWCIIHTILSITYYYEYDIMNFKYILLLWIWYIIRTILSISYYYEYDIMNFRYFLLLWIWYIIHIILSISFYYEYDIMNFKYFLLLWIWYIIHTILSISYYYYSSVKLPHSCYDFWCIL